MSGIGAGCGMMDSGGDSCLRSGRIDVWDDATANNQRLRKRHTCSYREGVTTGVMCCKKELDHVQNNKNSKCCYISFKRNDLLTCIKIRGVVVLVCAFVFSDCIFLISNLIFSKTNRGIK